ncbi:hypothetical protein CPC08DRAFT_644571 [Agrocybe pediades]|nr:hypothetical protein CPC08DRAFT_651640 [Agrocybe pediades]KAF9554252.1 hypothetical protein CPC08DRAFT_644571 [Agrocybe pediades]
MTQRRNRIHEDLMEMLQMLKFTMKSGRSLDFSAGSSREEVLSYVEAVMDAEIEVPEDLDAYIATLLDQVA